MGSNFVTVPKRYADSGVHPNCIITIDLDGHSKDNVFVLVPWKKVRTMAEDIIDKCIEGVGWGGFQTWGLQRTFDSVLNSTLDDREVVKDPVPAVVELPDGTLDTSVVAIPPELPNSVHGKHPNRRGRPRFI